MKEVNMDRDKNEILFWDMADPIDVNMDMDYSKSLVMNEIEERIVDLMALRMMWVLMPSLSNKSREAGIDLAVKRLQRLGSRHPSLKEQIEYVMDECYEQAVLKVIEERGLPRDSFPKDNFYTVESLLSDKFDFEFPKVNNDG